MLSLKTNATSPSEAKKIVQDAYKTGALFVARETFVYADHRLRAGQTVALAGGKWDEKLVEQGHLVPLEVYEREVARDAYAAHVARMEGLQQEKAIAIQSIQAAEASFESAQEHLEHMRTKLQMVDASIENAKAHAPAEVL